MKPFIGTAVAIVIAAIMASAQSSSTVAPAFEVASIKQSSTPFLEALANGSLVGMKISTGRVSLGHIDIAKLIQTAYNIKKYQLVGPDWLMSPPNPTKNDGLFDIEATLPAGATPDQVILMLQHLLAERFKLDIHKGSREYDTYALTVDNRLKIHDVPGPSSEEPAAGIAVSPSNKNQETVVLGSTTVSIARSGATQVNAQTMGGLVDYLAGQLPLPVIDKTGLKGYFDMKMEVLPSPRNQGVSPDPAKLRDLRSESIFAAVETLGLKLQPQKNLIETIIVDHVEKAPSEN